MEPTGNVTYGSGQVMLTCFDDPEATPHWSVHFAPDATPEQIIGVWHNHLKTRHGIHRCLTVYADGSYDKTENGEISVGSDVPTGKAISFNSDSEVAILMRLFQKLVCQDFSRVTHNHRYSYEELGGQRRFIITDSEYKMHVSAELDLTYEEFTVIQNFFSKPNFWT